METKPQQRRTANKPKGKTATTVVAPPTTPTDTTTATPATTVPVDPIAAAIAAIGETNGSVVADTTTDTTNIIPAKGTRTQTNKAIGIHISAARVRRWLDKLTLNKTIDDQIQLSKSKLIAYEAAVTMLAQGTVKRTVIQEVDGKSKHNTVIEPITAAEKHTAEKTIAEIKPQLKDLTARVSALSRERTRFSNESSIVLAIVCDEIIKQLVEHTMKRVLAAKKKIIQVEHLHEAGVTELPLYPLIKSLPNFINKANELARIAEKNARDTAISNAVAAAEKEFRKKYNVHIPKKKTTIVVTPQGDAGAQPADAAPPAADHNGTNGANTNGVNGLNGANVVAAAEPPADDDIDDAADSKTTFKFYVHQACKDIQTNPDYTSIRISTEIRNYLSELLIQFIQRIAPLVLLTAANMKNKTVNDDAIMRTIESIIIDGHKAEEHITLEPIKLPDPECVKAALAKREELKKADPNAVYEIDPKTMPQVDGFQAHKKIVYPSSGYDVLATKVHQRLAVYKSLSAKEKNGLVHDGDVAEAVH